MKRRRCTARVEHGRAKTRACGNRGPCTRVRIYNEAGELLQDRWVCFTCRQRMRLPKRDVDFRPGDTEVSDAVVYPDELEEAAARQEDYARGGHVPAGSTFKVGERGPEEFRLP